MGRAIALQLAREGAAVAMVARGEPALLAAAGAIEAETGAQITTVVADITTVSGRAAVLAACPAPDILVTNASGPPPRDVRELGRADWIAAIDAWMLTPIALMQATLDGMIARRFGRIVNIVSRSVKIAQPEMPLSNGARSGLVGFTAGLSRQVARHNVTINNLLPGIFATETQRRHVAQLAAESGRRFEDVWAEREAENPSGRYGEPFEIAAYCAFLCSAQAGFVTGQNLLVDGGSYPGTY